MRRVKPVGFRTPRLHEVRGISRPKGGRGISEDWSMRSSPRRLALKQQSIYVLHAVGTSYYKIGTAIDIEARKRKLQCGNPFTLKLVFSFCPDGSARRIESAIHAKAREQKRYSPADNEYFLFDNDQEVIDFCKNFGVTER